jgi:hypothetical protein
VKQKVALRHKITFRTQINGTFNDTNSADDSEYKNINVDTLFKDKYI